MRRLGRLGTLLGLLLAFLPVLLRAAPPPSNVEPQIERGRRIYLQGISPSGGKIAAVMNEGITSEAGVEVPASAVPCAGCHGRDGKGRPEGGVAPSDLTWTALTRPYGVTHPSGRKHPPYDVHSLKRAVTLGLDPAGNALSVAMPRFRMSLQDMDDLAAYLQRLGTGSDPGLEDRAVRIGVVLPPAGPLSAMGKTVRAAVTARFEAVNREGGLYGRRLEPRFFEAPEPADQRRGWTADFLQRERIFAAVGAYFAGADAEMDALFQEERIPVVGPFSLHPREDVPLNRYVFYLLPGLEMQEKALVAFAAGSGWPRPVTLSGAETDVELRRQAAAKADPILFLGSGPAALSLLRGADRAGWHPRVLVTAAAADGSLFAAPAAFEGKLFLGLPAPPDSASAQSAAVAAADVLVEAMKRAGRDLSREKLVDELESLNGFTTGFTPPVTFGAARRLGARGAWIARLDLAHRKTVSAGGWREAE